LATIRDIAEVLNLSRQTVSQILRNPEHSSYSEGTRTQVLKTAKELNYLPNIVARGLAQGKTHLVSMILPWNIPELMDTGQRTAKNAGYNMMVQFTPTPDPAMEARELMAALERRVDGIVWMPARYQDSAIRTEAVEQIKRTRTRLVLLETGLQELPYADTVCFDYEDGARQAVGHLVEQGYETIFSVTHPLVETNDHRDEGFLRVCAEKGVQGGLLVNPPAMLDEEVMTQALDRLSGPTAFFCGNDIFAFDLMKMLRQRGLAVPRDVGVVTVGDFKFGNRFRLGAIVSPSLTSVPRPFAEMAEQAVVILLSKSAARDEKPCRQIIPMELIVRESTLRKS